MLSAILLASILLQFAAAVLAGRMVRYTGRRSPWLVLAAAIALMAVRRVVTAAEWAGGAGLPPHLPVEALALGVSALMFAAMLALAPVLRQLRDSRLHADACRRNLERVFDAMDDLLLVVDSDGLVRHANRRADERLGRAPGGLAGTRLASLLPEEFRGEAGRFLAEVGGGRPVLRRWSFLALDGRPVPVEVGASPGDWAGQPVAVLTGRDIRERLRREEERARVEQRLRESQKIESLGILAGGIAHDFNNLLTAVMGHADLARASLPPDAPACRSLDDILLASHQAADLCRQMLAYSGRGRFVVERVDPVALVRDMDRLLRSSRPPTASLEVEFEDSVPAIEADPSQIRQIVMNLALNAFEALGEKSGAVTIQVGATACDEAYLRQSDFGDGAQPGRFVYLTVHDTGPGISAAVRARMFEPFFTTKFSGRGLGLAAVLGIVRSHRGLLRVLSPDGGGTSFSVFLPAADGPPAPPASPGEALPGHADGTVLLVDDDEAVRRVADPLLRHLGFRVALARNGREAVDWVRLRPPDDPPRAVLLDLTMPEMGGAATLRAMRAAGLQAPVLLSSGYTREEALAHFAQAEVAGFLQKPYSARRLAEALAAVLCGPAPAPPG